MDTAAAAVVKHQLMNPCCAVLKEKYSKLEASRNALRQGVKIQNELIDKLQNENLNLKKAYEEERIRADAERQEKLNESAIHVSLEKEIAALKSEIHLLQQRGGSQAQDEDRELMLLRTRHSELEAEIDKLKELVEKERMKAESERKIAEAEKKGANNARKSLNLEKSRADEERRFTDIERNKVKELQIQLEKLKSETEEARSKSVLEAFKSEEAHKEHEAEMQKMLKEKNRADLEMAKAEELKKLAEINQKAAVDEKYRADYLDRQLAEHKQRIKELEKEVLGPVSLRKSVESPANQSHKIMGSEAAKMRSGLQWEILARKSDKAGEWLMEEKQKAIKERQRADSEMNKAKKLRKVAEVNEKKVLEEKHRANHLARQLEYKTQKIEELEKEILGLLSSRSSVGATVVLPDTNVDSEIAKLKLLREKLKFRKKQAKHAKEVAKLELNRNKLLQQEFFSLKQGLVQFLHHLDILNNCFSQQAEGRSGVEKIDHYNTSISNLRRELFDKGPQQLYFQPNNGLRSLASDISGNLKQVTPLPFSGGDSTQCKTGIDSKLELLLRSSNRKMLESSAMNSSMASFSDRPSMGSQETGRPSSVTASAKFPEENSNSQLNVSTLGGKVTRTRYGENLAVVAENSVKSPIKTDAIGRRAGRSRKRKRIHDAVKSVENLYTESKKWNMRLEEKLSMLHGILNSQRDKSLENQIRVVPRYSEQVEASKRKRGSPLEKVALQHLCDSNKQKDGLGVSKTEKVSIVHQNLPPVKDVRGEAQEYQHEIGKGCFKEAMEGNYMKLLDLDNAVDEECYLKAVEMPLSPTLPEIEFKSSETLGIDTRPNSFDECPFESFLFEKNIPESSGSFDSIRLKLDNTQTHVHSTCKDDGVICVSKDVADNVNGEGRTVYADYACPQHLCDANAVLGTSCLCSSGCNDTDIISHSTHQLTFDKLPKYCVVFSDNEDQNSIFRIYGATKLCMFQCSMISHMDKVLQKIMLAIPKMEDLFTREKACVVFSVLLNYFSGWTLENSWSKDASHVLNTFAGCLNAVLLDVDTRSNFAEVCFSGELLTLIEGYLQDRRLLVHDESAPLSGSRVNLLVDEEQITLLCVMASTSQLVAGGFILASLCATVDHIGYLCEASYNILRTQKLDTSLVLNIVHVFAFVCGPKYFTVEDYNLVMTVVKSLVAFLESESSSRGCAYRLPFAGDALTTCTKCPFSEGALSMDISTSLLLEKLQNYALSDIVSHQVDSKDPFSSDGLPCYENITSHGEVGVFTSQPNLVYNEKLCHLTDVLSLMELVASNMRWEWTCNNVIPQILKLLESCTRENPFTAIVLFVGELGRLGVDASGYNDYGVESLRSSLSTFLCQNTSKKLGFPTQIAIVRALLSMIPVDFEALSKSSGELAAVISCYDSAIFVRDWYSTLSSGQRSWSFSVLCSTSVHSCRSYSSQLGE